jgi:hypothetical protein
MFTANPNTSAESLRLPTVMSRLLRKEFTPREDEPIYEGHHFVFEHNPTLFLGRRGRGPLRIVWDTNLLIDYFDHGRALWDGEALPDILPDEYREELEGLQLLVTLWVIRDIRFFLPEGTLYDARNGLSTEQANERSVAFDAFSKALSLVEWEGDELELPPLVLPASELARALELLPKGADRELVSEAVRSGAHVFMTRDRALLRTQAVMRPFGLLIASPLDVLEELCACGALHCLLHPRFAYWPAPDLQRVTHLIRALPEQAPA